MTEPRTLGDLTPERLLELRKTFDNSLSRDLGSTTIDLDLLMQLIAEIERLRRPFEHSGSHATRVAIVDQTLAEIRRNPTVASLDVELITSEIARLRALADTQEGVRWADTYLRWLEEERAHGKVLGMAYAMIHKRNQELELLVGHRKGS